MPRVCTVCAHPERAEIDAALVSGSGYRDIAGRWGLSKTAVARHASDHIPAALAESQAAREEARALDVVGQLWAINRAAQSVLDEAKKSKNHDMQLKAIDRIHRQIELQAKLLGELDDRPQINILLSAEWQAVRDALLAALWRYPEARVAVAAALASLDTSHTSQSAGQVEHVGGTRNGHYV